MIENQMALNRFSQANDITNYSMNNEISFDMIESYFNGKHLSQLIRHQIESVNDFIVIRRKKLWRCLIL